MTQEQELAHRHGIGSILSRHRAAVPLLPRHARLVAARGHGPAVLNTNESHS